MSLSRFTLKKLISLTMKIYEEEVEGNGSNNETHLLRRQTQVRVMRQVEQGKKWSYGTTFHGCVLSYAAKK